MVLVLPEKTTTSVTLPWQVLTSSGELPIEGPKATPLLSGKFRHAPQQINISVPVTWIALSLEGQSVLDVGLDDEVLIFCADGTFRGEPWLVHDATYFMLLAPGVHLTSAGCGRGDRGSFFGAWSGYHLIDVEAIGSTIRWQRAKRSGGILVIPELKVERNLVVRPEQAAVVVVHGTPPSATFDARDFSITNQARPDDAVVLLPGEVRRQPNALALDISRALPSMGIHYLYIQGPYGISAKVQVEYGPSITALVSDEIRWPNKSTGRHRLGTVSFAHPTDVRLIVDQEESWRMPSHSSDHDQFWLAAGESELSLCVDYQGHSYRRTWVLRDFNWEWTSMDHSQQINAPLSVTRDQFIADDWSWTWHSPHPLEIEVHLDDTHNPLKELGRLNPDHAHALKNSIRDDIDNSPGQWFRLIARTRDQQGQIREFVIASIHRPIVQQMFQPIETSSTFTVRWKGFRSPDLNGVVASLFGLYQPMPFSSKKVLHMDPLYGVDLPHPGISGPVVVSMGASSGFAERFVLHLRSGHAYSQDSFLKGLDLWLQGGQELPVPETFEQRRWWLECLGFVAPNAVARAVAAVVLPHLHDEGGQWILSALSTTVPATSLFRLGISQWRIADDLGTREARALTQKLFSLHAKSKIYAWLVGNGCYDFDPRWATDFFGDEGAMVAQSLAEFSFSTDARQRWIALIRSELFEVSEGESIMPPFSDYDASWLARQVSGLAARQPILAQHDVWASHARRKQEHDLDHLALLQRLLARGVSSTDASRLLHLQQTLPCHWIPMYERALVRAELLASLVEFIESRRSEQA